jgi:hypothetical protein
MEAMKAMKEPCAHCPFRKDVIPFLHPDRAHGLAMMAVYTSQSFSCHKTTVADEDSDEGEMLVTNKSRECAGMLTLRYGTSSVFIPKNRIQFLDLCYASIYDMHKAYKDEWEKCKEAAKKWNKK